MEIIIGFLILLIFMMIGLFVLKSSFTKEVNSLNENINQRFSDSQNNFFNTQQNVNESLKTIHKDLGSVSESSRHLLETSRSFEKVFRSPSPRGGIGEVLLENIIKEVLPPERVKFQYSFKNGKIADAVIFFSEGILAIDSKFPTDSFEKYVSSEDERDKNKAKRELTTAVKKKIDETSQYIIPEEGTFDFSFMYIPSESIFYEVVRDSALLDYAHSKKVFVAGPNIFYAYLKTVMVGFEGLKIQEETKKVLKYIKRLDSDFSKFKDNFSVLGSHLKNAVSKFNETKNRLENFSTGLKSLFLKGKDEDQSSGNS